MINPKKALVYGIIAITVVVMAVTTSTLIRSPSNNSLAVQSSVRSVAKCLGIAVDNQAGKVWYVFTKQGVLGDYNLITKNLIKR